MRRLSMNPCPLLFKEERQWDDARICLYGLSFFSLSCLQCETWLGQATGKMDDEQQDHDDNKEP